MNIYPEIKQIAGAMDRIHRLANKLKYKCDCSCVDWYTAKLIDGITEKGGFIYDEAGNCLNDDYKGTVDDDYYCMPYSGYRGDNTYGYLYFKTNVPGQFVRVYYET